MIQAGAHLAAEAVHGAEVRIWSPKFEHVSSHIVCIDLSLLKINQYFFATQEHEKKVFHIKKCQIFRLICIFFKHFYTYILCFTR